MRKYKLDKTAMLAGSIFALIGTLVLALCVTLTIRHIKYIQTAEQTQAVINEIETYYTRSASGKRTSHHRVYVTYTVDGMTYQNVLSHYDITMKEGGEVTVYYEPGNPSQLASTSTAECIILAIFGLIFGGIGYALLISQIRLAAYINRLIAEDKYIFADDFIERNSGTRVNNVRYHELVAICHDNNGTEYEFRSHPFHPSRPPFTQGKPIRVYVDLDNPRKYYVCEE